MQMASLVFPANTAQMGWVGVCYVWSGRNNRMCQCITLCRHYSVCWLFHTRMQKWIPVPIFSSLFFHFPPRVGYTTFRQIIKKAANILSWWDRISLILFLLWTKVGSVTGREYVRWLIGFGHIFPSVQSLVSFFPPVQIEAVLWIGRHKYKLPVVLPRVVQNNPAAYTMHAGVKAQYSKRKKKGRLHDKKTKSLQSPKCKWIFSMCYHILGWFLVLM